MAYTPWLRRCQSSSLHLQRCIFRLQLLQLTVQTRDLLHLLLQCTLVLLQLRVLCLQLLLLLLHTLQESR